MPNYLTRDDEYNYGSDLIGLAQRAAAQAFAPQLQALDQQNAELRRQVAEQARRAMHERVEAAVPNWREIDNDPRWHAWLSEIDPLSGATRQRVLDDAIAAGSAARVIAFFSTFQQQHGGGAARSPGRSRPRSAAVQQGEMLTRERIKQLYDQHRRGAYAGREAEWQRIEQQIIDAAATGNVVGALEPRGR
jgi:hypothetical protein